MSTKWTYEAIRTPEGVVASIIIDKNGVRERFPLHHFVKHSPTGFEMGYHGSGPADLAYSILVHWFLCYKFSLEEAQEEAAIQYQDFKRDFVAGQRDRLSIPEDLIGKWWIAKEIDKAQARDNIRFTYQLEGGRA